MIKQTIALKKDITPNGTSFTMAVLEQLGIDITKSYTYDHINHAYVVILTTALDTETLNSMSLLANTVYETDIKGTPTELADRAAVLHNKITAWDAMALSDIIPDIYNAAVAARDTILGQLTNG